MNGVGPVTTQTGRTLAQPEKIPRLCLLAVPLADAFGDTNQTESKRKVVGITTFSLFLPSLVASCAGVCFFLLLANFPAHRAHSARPSPIRGFSSPLPNLIAPLWGFNFLCVCFGFFYYHRFV